MKLFKEQVVPVFVILFFIFFFLDSLSIDQPRFDQSYHTIDYMQVDRDDNGQVEYELYLSDYDDDYDVSKTFYKQSKVGDKVALYAAEGTFTSLVYHKGIKRYNKVVK